MSGLVSRPPLPPAVFSNMDFERIKLDDKIDEECLAVYKAERYYPVRIGQVLNTRYQVIGKLGYGTFSTVWLARDLGQHRYVACKVYISSESMGSECAQEINTYEHMKAVAADSRHRGRYCVRTMLDSFELTSAQGEHQCSIHPPAWESVQTLLERNPIMRFPSVMVRTILLQVLTALDFMHKECRLAHTDIKAGNVLCSLKDDSIFEQFEKEELEDPSPRKDIDGRIIYATREVPPANNSLSLPILSDFGSVASLDSENDKTVQPPMFRAPEVLLGMPWNEKIDIWNVGCMAWILFQGHSLFLERRGDDIVYKDWDGLKGALLADIVSTIGQPPLEFAGRGRHSSRYFTDGKLKPEFKIPEPLPLEDRVSYLSEEEKAAFVVFMKKILQWEPSERSDARSLLKDPWLRTDWPTQPEDDD